MNHSQTMKGCSNPLVVKFADTQKEKDQKKQQQMINSLWNMANIVNLSAAAPAAHQPPATAYMVRLLAKRVLQTHAISG